MKKQKRTGCRSSDLYVKTGEQLTAAFARGRERAAVRFLHYPSYFEQIDKESRTDCAAEVRLSLAPVETGVGKTPASRECGFRVDTGGSELSCAGRREVIAFRICRQPTHGQNAVVQEYAESAGGMVVARTRDLQAAGRAGDEALVPAGEDTEVLKHAGNLRCAEPIIAMLSLCENANDVCVLELMQVNTGSRGADCGGQASQ